MTSALEISRKQPTRRPAPPRAAVSPSPAGAQPLYAWLRDKLQADIVSGRLPINARLPSESELGATHGISRITVRQALAELQLQGLVIKVQGKGSFVAPPRIAQELSQLRGLAESLAGSEHRIEGRLLAMEDCVADARVAAALGVARGDAVTMLRSLRKLDGVPLSVNRSYVPRKVGERLRHIAFANRDLLSTYEQELGLLLDHAELEIGAAAADSAHAKLLGVAIGTPLLRVTRIVFTSDGRALHFETALYRSDEFVLKLRLERTHTAVPVLSRSSS